MPNAPILMTYRGVGAFDENGDAWMHTSPLFETGDERYDWLNMVQGIAFGRLDGTTLVYDVHAVAGDAGHEGSPSAPAPGRR